MAFAQFNQTVTGTRPGAGSYVNGVWTPSAGTPLSIQTSVQPATQDEMKMLPEGRRVDSAYSLRSKTEIREGDVFDLYGTDHEVIKLQVWQNGVLPHYHGIAVADRPGVGT